jgi:hypothetical protein
MTEALWAQLIGAGSALTGVFLTFIFQLIQNKNETRRWRYNFFVPKEVEALHELLRTTSILRHTVIKYLYLPLADEQAFQEDIYSKYENFELAVSVANTYLDDYHMPALELTSHSFLVVIDRIRRQIGTTPNPQVVRIESEADVTTMGETSTTLIGLVGDILRANRITPSVKTKFR